MPTTSVNRLAVPVSCLATEPFLSPAAKDDATAAAVGSWQSFEVLGGTLLPAPSR